MSRNYYYTVASLPLLSYGNEPPFSMDDFLEMCRIELTGEDFSMVEGISLNPERINPAVGVLGLWKEWETSLRNLLAQARAKKRGVSWDDQRKTEGTFYMESLARQVLQTESPLEAEMIIDQARWDFISDQEMGHFFDLAVIIAYGIKLQILHRQQLFQEELGFQRYKEIYEQIMSAMDNDNQE